MENILIIGSGAREHVIAEYIKKSRLVGSVYISSSNVVSNTDYNYIDDIGDDHDKIVNFCKINNIDFVIVGPEGPLVGGLVDVLLQNNIACFGPTKRAAQIEGSKAFSKSTMKRLGIPTSDFVVVDKYENAKCFFDKVDATKYVIKLSGLAGGKGVFLPKDNQDAISVLQKIYENSKVEVIIIEKRLEGVEVSVLGFCNGKECFLMPQAQDYKRIFDGDTGPNTGGMGSICPVNVLSKDELKQLKANMTLIVKKLEYKGVLYAGVMKQGASSYSVLEFNCRFGDPEAQVILNLLESDLYSIMSSCLNGTTPNIHWKKGYVGNVVLSHKDYPSSKSKDLLKIENIKNLDDNIKIYWGNNKNGYTTGGRVCSVVSYSSSSLFSALNTVYNNIHKIQYTGCFYRRDIGLKYMLSGNTQHNNVCKKIKIAILGSTRGTSSQLLINSIKNGSLNANIEVIVSNRKKAGILEKAKLHSIPYVYFPVKKMSREQYDEKLVSLLRVYDVDVVLLIGYMRIVTSVFINEFKGRMFNIHPSLLPKYAGGMDMDVHQQIIDNDERYSGCTLHKVTEIVDGGQIIMQKQLLIDSKIIKNADILKTKIQALEQSCIVEFMHLCSNGNYNLWEKYSDAGVSIENGNNFVKLIKNLSKDVNKEVGGFCSIVPINNLTYIGLATDGVGTKIEIADKYNIYDTIGIDLVAMSVNDLIARGVRPTYFLDYLAVDKLDLRKSYEILKGIHKGCDIANCKLVGGETAELGNIYRVNGFDLAGFAVGHVSKEYILPKSIDNIVFTSKNWKLYGVPSAGLHSNGFSMIRKITRYIDLNKDVSLLNKILKPTRIYMDVLDLIQQYSSYVYAAAHITGGGFRENLKRVIPQGYTYKVVEKWKLPDIFKWVLKMSNISDAELNKTFNCGIGMALIVDETLSLEKMRIIIPDIVYIGEIV